MDHVLTNPNRNLTPYQRELMDTCIKLMGLRRTVGSLKLAANELNVSKETVDEIVMIWLEVNSVNEPVMNAAKIIASQGNVLVVATNNCPEFTIPFLQHNGIKHHFDDVFLPECMNGIRKPTIQYYSFVAKKMRVRPEDMILIDDQESNIEGLRKFGGDGILYQHEQDDNMECCYLD